MKYISIFIYTFLLFSIILCSKNGFLSNIENAIELNNKESNINIDKSINDNNINNINSMNFQMPHFDSNGFIDLNLLQKSIKKTNNNNSFRFLSTQRGEPAMEELFRDKRGFSNGVILYRNRRTANFASEVFTNSKVEDVLNAIELKQDLGQISLNNLV